MRYLYYKMSSNINFNVEQIGLRLREVRKKLGKTLEQMRDITGLSTGGISEMEKGLKKPSSVYMFALKRRFDININWVLTGVGTMFSPDIELDLDFGEDNKLIQELILCIKNVDIVRLDILSYFSKFKRENPGLIQESEEED